MGGPNRRLDPAMTPARCNGGHLLGRMFKQQSSQQQQLVPVEALPEFDVLHIQFDGREIVQSPPTAAEHFQRIVNRIDFSQQQLDNDSPQSPPPHFDQKTKDDDDDGARIQRLSDHQLSTQLWAPTREAVRMALTEITALLDVLAVVRDGKYMSLNAIASELNFPMPALMLAGKKKALSTATEILMKGTERLRRCRLEQADARSRLTTAGSGSDAASIPSSFDKSLAQLRQHWRLKWHTAGSSTAILGDVSLRACGSRQATASAMGSFEIREADLVQRLKDDSEQQQQQAKDGEKTLPTDALEVKFSHSLERLLQVCNDPGLVKVSIGENSGDENSVNKENNGLLPSNSTNSVEARLIKAQRILASRELLFTLACEANGARCNSDDGVATFVGQDNILLTILPGVQVSISLDLKSPSSRSKAASTSFIEPSLGLQLHSLLAEQHQAAWHNLASLPSPTSNNGPVQIPHKLRSAGARVLPHDHEALLSSDHQNKPFSINVAAVSGYACPAASAWLGTAAGPTSAGGGRIPLSIGQDRLSLFTEWGSILPQSQRVEDESSSSSSQQASVNLSLVEQLLLRRGVNSTVVAAVCGGSSGTLLSRTTDLCRHYYLRKKTYSLLTRFSAQSYVSLVQHWTSVPISFHSPSSHCRVSFYVRNYDARRLWLGLTIDSEGLTITQPADPARVTRIGGDFDLLWNILACQALQTQLYLIDEVMTRIVGWDRLGSNWFSGLTAINDQSKGPVAVKLFASTRTARVVCLRASLSEGGGIRLFVSRQGVALDNTGGESDQWLSGQFREIDLGHGCDVAKIEAIVSVLG